jgi:hypothetical protein
MAGRVSFSHLQRLMRNAAKVTPKFKKVKHVRSGKEYVIKDVALEEATLKPLVIYQPVGQEGILWARPHEDFVEKFK